MTRHAKKNKKPMVISWRFAFVVLSLSTIFVGLVARAAYIQVVEPDLLVERGDQRSLRVKSADVMRGMILDLDGPLTDRAQARADLTLGGKACLDTFFKYQKEKNENN